CALPILADSRTWSVRAIAALRHPRTVSVRSSATSGVTLNNRISHSPYRVRFFKYRLDLVPGQGSRERYRYFLPRGRPCRPGLDRGGRCSTIDGGDMPAEERRSPPSVLPRVSAELARGRRLGLRDLATPRGDRKLKK